MASAPFPSTPVPGTLPTPWGDGLMRCCAAGVVWHLQPELRRPFFGAHGLRLSEWIATGCASVVKHGPHRTVYRVTLPEGVYYLKHYRVAGTRAWLQNNLRPARALREATAAVHVRAAGIATAVTVGVGRQVAGPLRCGPFSADSYFVTREIPGVEPLDEWALAHAATASPTLRRNLIAALADLTATLHRRGLEHADYHAGNVLLRVIGDAVQLWLIDLHPLRPARMTTRRRWTMLGMLGTSLGIAATAADRLRFFRAYAAALGVCDQPTAVATFCAHDEQSRQRRADRKWRRGNRRVFKVDVPGLAARGLAILGREPLNIARERLHADPTATLPFPAAVRVLPAGCVARQAWETGHALHRRGFPVPQPLLFVGDSLLALEPTPTTVPVTLLLEHAGAPHPASQASHCLQPRRNARLLHSLGHLLRRLHTAGFTAPPAAFAVAAGHRLRVPGLELVRSLKVAPAVAVQSFLAALPDLSRSDQLRFLSGYAGRDLRLRRRLWQNVQPRPRRAIPKRRLGNVAALMTVLLACGTVWLAGCRGIEKTPTQEFVTLPAKHSVRADHLVVVSDFKLPPGHPLVDDLVALRGTVTRTLALPEPRRDVTVYLFAGEEPYRKYLDGVHPGLPPRRAYFVGTKKELAVYTYWGDRVQEDLRHEYTHGLLHASLETVPLWLDEGLAEYFEVPGEPGSMNGDYPHQLAVAVSRGWRPDIDRLERLEEFAELQRRDYQESWAWVHYMLHASPATRQELVDYLAELRDTTHPPHLADRLAVNEPSYPARFLGYVATLNTTGGAVIRAASADF